jgi:hypothetical protein
VRAAALLAFLGLATGSTGVAFAETLTGSWSSPLGAMRLTQQGDRVLAAARRNPFCTLPSSGHVLEGDLLDDSLSGQLFVCFAGCDRGPGWVPVLLLVAPDGKSLSGTSTLPRGCKAAFGPSGGAAGGSDGSLVLRRLETTESAKPADDETAENSDDVVSPPAKHATLKQPGRQPAKPPAPSVAAAADRKPAHSEVAAARESPETRERAMALARDGAAFQEEGKFEQARHRFTEAIELDPLYVEGYNGVGVTFFARNDLAEALRWYKKALGVDPTFGDAYYNMACVYALQKRSNLALRYLKTAFHKGYTSRETLRSDPDLASLHGDPAFEALLGEPQ